MNKKEKIQAKEEAMHILISLDEIINLLKSMNKTDSIKAFKSNKDEIRKSKELQNFVIMSFTDNKK